MSTTQTTADIVIVGGGIAGCIAALALAPQYRVVLVDQHAAPPERIGECLPPAARRILRHLNLWDAFEREQGRLHTQALGVRSYWGSAQAQINDHLRNPDGFGYHLDRAAFERFLRRAVVQTGVTCWWPARFEKAEPTRQGWQIECAREDRELLQVQASFVIDASGRKAVFARRQGVKREASDHLVACWATLRDESQDSMATIVATPNGWWYSAPLPNAKRVLAFQTDSDLVEKQMGEDVHYYQAQASQVPQMREWLGDGGESLELKGMVAANSSRLTQVAGARWAALGDAALSFDPLSAQGMYNAMATAMQLTDLMTERKLLEHEDADIGHRYSQQIEQIQHYYEKHKTLFYAQETRWPDSPFWRRRHAAGQ